MLNNPFHVETFPNIEHKPPLTQLNPIPWAENLTVASVLSFFFQLKKKQKLDSTETPFLYKNL